MKVEIEPTDTEFYFGINLSRGCLAIDIPNRVITIMTNKFWESIQPPEDMCTVCGKFVWKHDDHDHKFVVPAIGLTDEQKEFLADAEEFYNKNPF